MYVKIFKNVYYVQVQSNKNKPWDVFNLNMKIYNLQIIETNGRQW